jgi:hypothetical protein
MEPSIANRPDLDWSQVRETVRMLYLASAQVAMALQEGDSSIESLSGNFTGMIGNVNAMTKALSELPQTEENASIIQSVEENAKEVTSHVQESIVAFQFYDKLSQRLSHVTHALESLSGLVCDQNRIYNPNEWTDLQGQIRSRYSMKEEQLMFDLLLQGGTIEDALKQGEASLHEDTSNNDIELF